MKNKFKEIEVNINPQGVCEITLNRPDKHNAMSRKMIDELEAVSYTHLTLPTNREV